MPEIKLPSPQFPTGSGLNIAAGGRVFIGVVNLDPTIEANRLTVTIIDVDGSSVVVQPSSQPFILNSAAMLTLNGSIVQLRVSQNYSMTLEDSTGDLLYYFPNANITSDVSTSLVSLSNTSTPGAIVGIGQIYTRSVGGGIELFYLDADGNEVQLTSNGEINVDLGTSNLVAASMTAGYFRGDVIALTSVNNTVVLDWTAGQYFTLTNTETTTFVFSNEPLIGEGIGQTIMLAIEDAGNFAITLDPSTGFTINLRAIDNPLTFTTDGLDIFILTVYASGIITVIPLYDFSP